MQKSNTPLEGDMVMIRIQALELAQGTIQDLVINNVTGVGPYTTTNRLAVICLLQFSFHTS